MKYLKKFDTESEVFMLNMPNVVLVGDTNKVLYNVDSTGVYIQHIDGSLYNKDVWSAKGFANTEANGVAVVDKDATFVVALKTIGAAIPWSKTANLIDGIFTTTNNTEAFTDLDGLKNTDLIASIDTNSAAYKCKEYTFPNGKKGYLPSAGEFNILWKYITDVDEALSVLGTSSIIPTSTAYDTNYWLSTQASETNAWMTIISNSGNPTIEQKDKTATRVGSFTDIYARPFTTL